ncbi:MAG: hypothetical protein JW703_00770 [Candidatus Diapherotrites archaeon]|nr:hypothetical protein [Candidatus Diapherotrites archaeon]
MKLNELREEWKEVFQAYCLKNEHIEPFMFHLLLGKIVNTRFMHMSEELSTRLSLMIIQPSSTGKGQSTKALKKIVEKINELAPEEKKIELEEYTESTDAGLTHSIATKKITINNVTREGEKVTKRLPQPVPGSLGTADILICTEGSAFLKPGPFSRQVIGHLQTALDEPGRVSLKRGMFFNGFNYPTEVSIILTSYEFQDLENILLVTGLIQRFLILFEEISDESWQEIHEKAFIGNVTNSETKIDSLAEKFFKLKNQERKIIKINESDQTLFYEKFFKPSIKLIINSIKGKQKKDIVKSFFMRLILPMKKIAVQKAFIEKKDEVSSEEWHYAFEIIQRTFFSIKKIINCAINNTKENQEKEVEKILTEKKLTISQLKDELLKTNNWGIGYNKSGEVIKKLRSEGKILEEKGEKNTVYLSWKEKEG